MANFFADLLKGTARTLLPKELEYKLGITEKPKVMTFPVGEGMTEQQKIKADNFFKSLLPPPAPNIFTKTFPEIQAYRIEKEKFRRQQEKEFKRLYPERYKELETAIVLTSIPGGKKYVMEEGMMTPEEIEILSLPEIGLPIAGMKIVSAQEAQKILINAAKLTRQDLQDITTGKITSGVKLEAYKAIVSNPEGKKELMRITQNQKIPLKEKITSYVKDWLDKVGKVLEREEPIKPELIGEAKKIEPISKELEPLVQEVRKYPTPDLYGISDNLVFNSRKEAKTYIDTQFPIKSQLTDIWEKANKILPRAQKEVSGAVRGIKAEVPKGSEWKERGFITSVKEELPELKVAGQYVPRSTDRLAIKAKNLIKTNLNIAEKIVATKTDDNAIAIGSELLKHYTDEASKLGTSQAAKDALYEKAGKLANDMARRLTEQGRSVQAASILSRLTPEGQLKFAAREIQRYNEEVAKTGGGLFGLKKKIPEITKEQVKHIKEEMSIINLMPDGEKKSMRFFNLQNYITDLVPTPLFKKIIAIWKAGLLTGIKTSGLNIFANISHAQTEITKDIPATIVDKIVSLFTGKRTVAFTVKGELKGAKEGFGKGWRYLKTGFDERNIGTKLDYKRINFGKGKLARGLQAYTDTIFKLMGTEDQPFYYSSKLRSLYEQAKVAAINKKLKGKEAQKFIDNLIQNPTDEMIKYASIDAETAVFQNPTLLGKAARSIQKTGVGEIIVPFGRTPSAVAMQIFNYSPAGIVKTIFENVGKGRFNQRLFSQGMGRGITGIAVLALGALLFKKGMMTLDRPIGEKEQKLWELEGKKANSIYDPFTKKWRTVQILGPVGNVLLIGGHFQNAFDKSGSPSEAISQTLAGASKSFTEQTFLTGVSNFIDAISDPARSAKNVAGSTLASAIPTIMADISRATDEKERRANEIFEKFMAKIPGLREKLEPQITVLGDEKERIGNPLEVMADPTRPSPEIQTPLIQELRRLWDVGYKVSPTLLGDKAGYKILTPQENTELWKRTGEIINSKLSNFIKDERYLKLKDEEKAKYVEEFVDKSKTVARAEMVLKLTKGLNGEELRAKLSELKKSGLMTKEVFKKWQELR